MIIRGQTPEAASEAAGVCSRNDQFDPSLAIDNRRRVVDMWRAEGLVCAQVAEGDFWVRGRGNADAAPSLLPCGLLRVSAMKHGISLWRAYAYAWITLGLFAFSLVGHWLFGWFAYVDEQTAHGQPVAVAAIPC